MNEIYPENDIKEMNQQKDNNNDSNAKVNDQLTINSATIQGWYVTPVSLKSVLLGSRLTEN